MASFRHNLPIEIQKLTVKIPPLFDIESLLNNDNENEKTHVKKPTRCCFDGCKKKLALSDFPCKCGKIHCTSHRPAELHSCSFDFKANHKENLLQYMSTAVTAAKIDAI
jgi:hypothetical protein